MAESTEWIVVVSWGQLALATAGTILVFGSLGIAYSANRTAREMGQAQVRAYLSYADAECSRGKDWFWCYPRIRNHGQSPAYKTEITAHVEVAMPPQLRGISGGSKEVTTTGNYIAAGGDERLYLAWSRDDFGAEAYAELATGAARFDVVCLLKWIDVFKKPQELRFRIEFGAHEVLGPGPDAVTYKQPTILYRDPEGTDS
jgi:hypothetical protein